ncbi:xylan 1,4-beta-xylosidase [Streptomyces sp. NPDC088733]|uniref:GH39 family glycosyl hydrolase n=1 Tax=Streptomyces sp. NPDC088733 TaxID=3365880 RepID=UPI00382E43C8
MGRHGDVRAKVPGAGRRGITALLGIGVVALALLLTTCDLRGGTGDGGRGSAGPGAGVHSPSSTPTGKPSTELGFGLTHTEYSADHGEGPAKRAVAGLLSERSLPQDQAIMGWGADNPEPAPGKYDFGELDDRIDLIRASGGTPVITLCCAPDWMKGGAPGARTDWSRLEVAPDPSHFDDFAALAATVARRYPDVRHFIVWNEFKGFWNDGEQRWDYEGYTDLYNRVYQAVKKVNPDNLVGGPYLVMDSFAPGDDGNGDASGTLKGPWGAADRRVLDAVDYWLRHKAGADFLVADGSSTNRDDSLVPDEFAATEKFAAVGRWLKQRSGGLPLWWAEWYVEPDGKPTGWDERHRTAVQAAAMMELARGGADAAFYWNPQERGKACPGCLWTSTELSSGGGRQLPMMDLLRRFGAAFPPGTRFRTVSVAEDDRPNVRVLADDKAVLVVNTLDRPIRAAVDGRSFDLPAYGIHWLRRGR